MVELGIIPNDPEHGQNPLVSLIIPVYSVEPYLRKCLNSILGQNFDRWEAILIDDGSPDKCGGICDDYANFDSRFKVIHHTNAGVSHARNAGINHSTGEWLWFVDPDDWLADDALINLQDAIKRHNSDLIIFGIEYYDEKLNQIGNENRPNCDGPKDDVIDLGDYPPQNYIVKRELVQDKNIRYSEGVPIGEDLEFQYKCLMTCLHPISISGRLYHCLRRQGSAMRNKNTSINSASSSIIVLEHLIDFIIEENVKETPWLSVRLNRAFKRVLSSHSKLRHMCPNVQRRLNGAYMKIKDFGYRDFSDLAINLGAKDMRIYWFLRDLLNALHF